MKRRASKNLINEGQDLQIIKKIENEENVDKHKYLPLASADVFSLGVLLLQIATGYPSQLELPIKVRCQSVDQKFYLAQPHFGYCVKEQIDKMQVFQTIKRQERFINNINFFLLVGNDPYNFL